MAEDSQHQAKTLLPRRTHHRWYVFFFGGGRLLQRLIEHCKEGCCVVLGCTGVGCEEESVGPCSVPGIKNGCKDSCQYTHQVYLLMFSCCVCFGCCCLKFFIAQIYCQLIVMGLVHKIINSN